jgi:hypothetical protein
MAESEQKPGGAGRLSAKQALALGVSIGLGMAAGRLVGDATREPLGYWGSVGVGTLAAAVVALLVALLVQLLVRPKS